MKATPAQRASAADYYQENRDKILPLHRAYDAEHKDDRRARDASRREQRREENAKKQRWFTGNLRVLRAAQGCGDCGTSGGLLDHHHTDPSTRRYKVSQMRLNSLEAFVAEIAKCTVLCRSCHKSRHDALRAASS